MRVHASSAARRAAPPATASRVAVRRAASPLAARRSETSRGALADPSSRLPRLRRASSRRASSRDGRRRAATTTTTSPPRAMFDPDSVDDPLLRKAMKEPVAFFGGLFAGFLGLRVDEAGSPLKAWVDAAAEDAGARLAATGARRPAPPPARSRGARRAAVSFCFRFRRGDLIRFRVASVATESRAGFGRSV